MSRTHKDKKWKYRSPENAWEYGTYNTTQWYWLKYPGAFTKKRKEVDTECHWMTTPGWWVRMMMNKPQRVASKQWEREVVKMVVEDLVDADPPSLGKKPHVYYW